MATIEKRTDSTGAITYRAKVRLKGYPQESASFARKTDAKQWSANTESALLEGRYFKTAASKYRTLTDAIERYRSELLPKLKDPQHRLHHLTWWEGQIGHTILADLRRIISVVRLVLNDAFLLLECKKTLYLGEITLIPQDSLELI